MVETDLVMKFIETLEGLRRYRRWFRNRSLPISKNEMMLLMFLYHHLPEDDLGMQPSELGRRLRLTRPTITSLVNSLEEHGYVVRINDEADRRVVFVRPTPKGETLVKQTYESFTQSVSEMIEYLGEKDAKELIRIMGQVRQFIKHKNAMQDRSKDSCGN